MSLSVAVTARHELERSIPEVPSGVETKRVIVQLNFKIPYIYVNEQSETMDL